jgi:hypothetical protein
LIYCSDVISEQALTQLTVLPPPPQYARAVVVVPPPGIGAGWWTGAPSAVQADNEIFLAYRLRRGTDRGYAVAVARSADGERFETVAFITKEEMAAASLERPALVPTPEGAWRLYLSCATEGSKHWRVEVIEAADPAAFDSARRRVVLPGDAATAVKDPVILLHGGSWHLWASVHPLTDPEQTDRMSTWYATSADGLDWEWQGVALSPRPGEWDARGARVTSAAFTPEGVMAYYDGRASAAANFEERTGFATGAGPDCLTAVGTGPVAESPEGGHGLRYLSFVDLGGGAGRLYYEVTRADGSHELCTEVVLAG